MKRVWSDEAKFNYWLQVEGAVCDAWAELGHVPPGIGERVRQVTLNMEDIDRYLQMTHHDLTAFLQVLADELGDDARFVHLGLTSSDVMDTALSLQVLEAARILKNDIDELIQALAQQAVRYKKTLMVGRTHGVHAEPTTFGLKLALWHEEMKRNRERLEMAIQTMAVGKISGAVGTYATVPPEIEQVACSRLGLQPAPISNQVLQRDRHAQFVTCLAIIMGSLEKFATEIRNLQKTEVREVEEPFASGQTGSSAMPHKRNPELCERICGLARLVRGYAMTALQNVALWHERDISHSSTERVILPDACLVTDYCLDLFTDIVKRMSCYPERMKENLELTRGLIFSQRVMLALIEKGLSRQEAYHMVQRNAMRCWQTGANFIDLLQDDSEVMARLSHAEIIAIFDYSYYLRYVDHIFDRLGLDSTSLDEASSND